MRLICPNCQQAVNLPDTDAGKTVVCPQCSHSFSAPQLFTPPVAALPPIAPAPISPPVANSEPARPQPEAPAPQAVSLTLPAGYTHQHFHSLSRKVCEWLVPISFTLIFLLSFFSWIGMYPGGYAAYTQNAWQALFASISVDPVSEKLLKKDKELNDALRSSWWMLPYLLLMIFGLVLAWADHVIKWFSLKLPAIVQNFWRFRPATLSACVGLTFILLLIQNTAGFGLERALYAQIEETFKEKRAEAKTPEEIQIVEMQIGEKIGAFHLQRTIWLRLAIFFHLLAVIGIIGETLLIHRGEKPPPRIGVMW